MDYFEYLRAIRASDLSYSQRLVALMIASHYDFSNPEPCYPTNKTLSKETGLSIATLVRAKKVLSERGYLCSERQWDSSNRYTPMLPESTGAALCDELNTHINTHTNTNINTHINNKSSNEDLYSSFTIKKNPVDIINIKDNSLWL